MIANIIPATRLPRSINYFSYLVPPNLKNKVKAGLIVEINFRNRNIPGLIIKINKNKKIDYKLKKINKILFPQPLVTKNQIKLIDYIANYYAVAPSIVVKSLLPKIPKRIKNIKIITKNVKKNKKYKKELFWYQDKNEIIKLLKNKIKFKKQILILVPQIEMINRLAERLNLKENQIIKIHNGIAKTKLFKNWLEILAGKPKIIIGSKISVLLPFSNLKEIIIYDEHNWNHKQSDINPRFDARNIAEWITRENECGLTLTTPAPRIETYYLNAKTKTLEQSLNALKTSFNDKNILIIDLKQERLKGNYTPLSDELIYSIKNNLDQNKKTFIFHNRKGLAQFVVCHDCGYVFECPECKTPLVYHTDDKKLHCHYCNYTQDSPPLCPSCQGPNIKFKRQGIEKIKLVIQKEFPQVKVLAISKAVKQFDNSLVEQSDIIIGTEFVLNKIDFSKFNLIAYINFDQLLNRPDFRSQEWAYQLFYEIKSQTPNAKFIIQTYKPENIVLKSIQQNKPKIFYKSEIANRKELNYPPFIKIIKLIYQDKNEKRAFNNAKKIFRELKKIRGIQIAQPFMAYPQKVRNKFKYNIIIKTPLNFNLQKIIKLTPNNFIIDVEPERLN